MRSPVPALLMTALKEHNARQSGRNPNNLVFPTSNGRPDKKFEQKLKTIARRAAVIASPGTATSVLKALTAANGFFTSSDILLRPPALKMGSAFAPFKSGLGTVTWKRPWCISSL